MRRNTRYKEGQSIGIVTSGNKTKNCRLQHKALCTLLCLSLLSFCCSCVRRWCRCPFCCYVLVVAPSLLHRRVAPSSLRCCRRAVILVAFDRLSSVACLCPVLLVKLFTSASLWSPTANPIALQSKGRFDGKIVISLKPVY